MQLLSYSELIKDLLATDYTIFKRTIKDKLIDLCIWIVTMVFVTAYLMPAFGLEQSYTGFMIASLIGSAGLFELYTSVTNLVSDFTGINITSYYLTLPMPSWLVFLRSIIFYTFNTAVLGIWILPMCKILLWNHFDLSQFSLGKFLLIYLLTNIFYAAFTLWTASKIKNLESIGSVWMRFVYPIWFLGGFQYSWIVLKNFSPTLAYISLINPMVYVMEGMRAAILGQEGSLDFWTCIGALTIFTLICSWRGIKGIKTKLDYV